MDFDDVKLQEAVFALLGAFEFENGRVWKRYDFSVMEALHEQGWITDPHGQIESVYLTNEGRSNAEALADKYFGAESK